jgi:uncharacterized membrane protein
MLARAFRLRRRLGELMKIVNLALVCIAAVLCLFVGAVLKNLLLLGLSVVIVGSAFVINQKLEQRRSYRPYEKHTSSGKKAALEEEIRAPDFFEYE